MNKMRTTIAIAGKGLNTGTILRFARLVQLSVSLLIVTHPSFAGSSWNHVGRRDVLQIVNEETPYFDAIISGIDAYVGETVLLPCTVRNIGDKVVSWMRRRDLSILTSGTFAFTADNRIESVHNHDADFWGLRIRGVRLVDAGQYECQVNTDPKMNLAVNLSVTDRQTTMENEAVAYTSKAHIVSSRVVFVRSGSTLSLTCEISPGDEKDLMRKLARVRWLHEDVEITSKFGEGGVSVETDYRRGKITSRLILSVVLPRHSGKFTCSRRDTKEDSIVLRVTQDEHIEAMQRDSSYTSTSRRNSVQVLTFGIYLLLYII